MRVIGICCFRNESDIIEAFIRHTAVFRDELVLLDHGSTDASVEIVRQLQREGLPLRLLYDPTLGNVEVQQINRLLKFAASELSADWILFLDADEFIQGARDNSFLPVPVDNESPCLKLSLKTYYPRSDDPVAVLNPVERITRRLASEPWAWDEGVPWQFKAVIPSWLARKEGGLLTQGKHYFLTNGIEAPHRILKDVSLAHFSLRSPAQYATKLIAKQLQKLRYIGDKDNERLFYDKPYELLRQSYSGFVDQFHSMRYVSAGDVEHLVEDPLQYLGAPLRHTSPTPDTDSLIRNLLALSERLARTSPDKTPAVSSDTATPAQIAIELTSHQDPVFRKLISLPVDRTQIQTLIFPLDCPSDTTAFRLNWHSEQGMIEISRITLI